MSIIFLMTLGSAYYQEQFPLANVITGTSTKLKNPAPSVTMTFNGRKLIYPAIDETPNTDDPIVKRWVKTLDFSKVPNLPPSNGGQINYDQPNCKAETSMKPNQGSWTCQKYTAPDDIVTCPKKGDWGLTYDDGPSKSTPKLLDFLLQRNLKATFFVTGSRVISNPLTLKAAYDSGHHIAVHTWSHPALTSLSNESIVAELRWTIKAIHDITNATPNYFRPPYGDTDNRVRAISKAVGLVTTLWLPEFDSNDWSLISDLSKPVDAVVQTFDSWMARFPKMSTGLIVLQHDLHPRTVGAALSILDKAANVRGLNITTVSKCIGDIKPYAELGINTRSGHNLTDAVISKDLSNGGYSVVPKYCSLLMARKNRLHLSTYEIEAFNPHGKMNVPSRNRTGVPYVILP
ncbi:13441_t:CDS:2 [Acaulospora colombiana]|uniref:13441_t:CDS:1 n=1 Tax=Acaulospora colombiana TaxID=27376 RepID=A0ACA9KXU4_9GLOM|nr:13441_t:CDS:2 [Acaulospora colombiana]